MPIPDVIFKIINDLNATKASVDAAEAYVNAAKARMSNPFALSIGGMGGGFGFGNQFNQQNNSWAQSFSASLTQNLTQTLQQSLTQSINTAVSNSVTAVTNNYAGGGGGGGAGIGQAIRPYIAARIGAAAVAGGLDLAISEMEFGKATAFAGGDPAGELAAELERRKGQDRAFSLVPFGIGEVANSVRNFKDELQGTSQGDIRREGEITSGGERAQNSLLETIAKLHETELRENVGQSSLLFKSMEQEASRGSELAKIGIPLEEKARAAREDGGIESLPFIARMAVKAGESGLFGQSGSNAAASVESALELKTLKEIADINRQNAALKKEESEILDAQIAKTQKLFDIQQAKLATALSGTSQDFEDNRLREAEAEKLTAPPGASLKDRVRIALFNQNLDKEAARDIRSERATEQGIREQALAVGQAANNDTYGAETRMARQKIRDAEVEEGPLAQAHLALAKAELAALEDRHTQQVTLAGYVHDEVMATSAAALAGDSIAATMAEIDAEEKKRLLTHDHGLSTDKEISDEEDAKRALVQKRLDEQKQHLDNADMDIQFALAAGRFKARGEGFENQAMTIGREGQFASQYNSAMEKINAEGNPELKAKLIRNERDVIMREEQEVKQDEQDRLRRGSASVESVFTAMGQHNEPRHHEDATKLFGFLEKLLVAVQGGQGAMPYFNRIGSE